MSRIGSDLKVPFARPDISPDDVEAVADAVRSGWITTGPRVVEFERSFREACGAAHVVMLNSCTAALHLALDAAGLQRGDEVIVPSLTFAATAEVVCYFGATPVFVDVHPTDHNMDPAAVAAAIGPKTRAVIPVHFGGVPCDMDEILQICSERGIAVIADAAHCFPCEYRGRPVGVLADINCFSFYATKTITTGEGGALATENAAWAERVRVMALHGMSKDAWTRYADGGTWRYDISAAGFKYNMTDVAAALGISQLKRAVTMRDRRAQIAQRYDRAFLALDHFEVLVSQSDRGNAHHLYVLKLRRGALRIERDQFVDEMSASGIATSVHFIPLHLQRFYKQFQRPTTRLSVTEDVWARSLSLPIHSSLSDDEVDAVIAAVRELSKRFSR